MKNKTMPTSFSLDHQLIQGLKIKSFELSLKRGKKVTASAIVAEALLKFGVVPSKAKND